MLQGPEWVWPVGFLLRAYLVIGKRLGEKLLEEAKQVWKNIYIFKQKKIKSTPLPDCDLCPVSPLQPSLQVSLERTAGTDQQGRGVLQRLQPNTGGENILELGLSKPLEIRFVLLLPFVTNLQNRTGSDLFSPDKIRHVTMRPQGAPMWPKATHGGRRPPSSRSERARPAGA